MSGYIKDRWLWLGLCITFVALFAVQTALSTDADISAVEDDQEDEEHRQRAPSMRLPLKTLRTLIDSPNPNISQMAIDLVLSRAHHPHMRNELCRLVNQDSVSTDPELRRKAILTMGYLQNYDRMANMLSPVMSQASSSSPHFDSYERLEIDDAIIPSTQEPVAGWTAVPRERPPAGDDDVRRRRREAVVLHEGAGEINEDDIIRPGDLH